MNPHAAETETLVGLSDRLLADSMNVLRRLVRALGEIELHIATSKAAIEASRRRLKERLPLPPRRARLSVPHRTATPILIDLHRLAHRETPLEGSLRPPMPL